MPKREQGELIMPAIPSVTLNNDVEMPLLGFGVFQVTDADETPDRVPEMEVAMPSARAA